MRRFRWLRQSTPRPGFTLVELLIASVVMVLATIGSTVLFNQATRQGLSGNRRLEEQLAISRDLAAILEVNERYNCDLSGCDATPDQPSDPFPDQADYAPAEIDAPLPGGSSFRALCASGLLTNLLEALERIGEIDTQTQPGKILLSGTQVERTVSLLDVDSTTQASLPPHRYRVDWLAADDRLLRQVQLSPTVAAWCP